VDLSICIVSWNTRELLDACLSSVAEHSDDLEVETFVVDNASSDGSARMVREHHPDVILIENGRNVGFAAANNQAMERATGRYVFMLNPDTEVLPGALKALVDFMDAHPEAGAAGCRLVSPDGTRQKSVRTFPTFRTFLHQFTILRLAGIFAREYGNYRMRDFDDGKVFEIDIGMGAALIIRRSVLDEVGLLDPNFFMYFEEVDICRRIKLAGHKIYFFPGATILHHGGQSAEQARVMLSRVRLQSVFTYLEKYNGPEKTALFKLLFKPLFYMKLLCDLPADLYSLTAYKTFKRDPRRARRVADRIRATGRFFGRDLLPFLFCD